MFGFFRRRKKAKKLARRDIFQFWDFRDGKRIHRAVDPMIAWDVMWHGTHQCVPAEDFPLIEEVEVDDEGNITAIEITTDEMRAEQKDAMERAMDMISQMFGVMSYDPDTDSGLTVNERIDLLANFQWYMHLLKKKRSPLQTQSAPTAQESSDQKNSPTNSDAASSSTKTESIPNEQQPS